MSEREEALRLAREITSQGIWEKNEVMLARALLDCERERADVEMDRRFQQDRARAAEHDLAALREAVEIALHTALCSLEP